MAYEKYRFTREHEWVKLDDDVATIGITKYATDELGDVVYVELHNDTPNVQQKEEVGTIESVKTVSSLYSPLSGDLLESNTQVIKDPNLVNEAPLEEGWLIKIKPTKTNEWDKLMTLNEYEDYTKSL